MAKKTAPAPEEIESGLKEESTTVASPSASVETTTEEVVPEVQEIGSRDFHSIRIQRNGGQI